MVAHNTAIISFLLLLSFSCLFQNICNVYSVKTLIILNDLSNNETVSSIIHRNPNVATFDFYYYNSKGNYKKCHRTILTMAFYNLYFNYITNYFFNKISYMMHHICCLQDKLVLKKLLLHDSLFSTQFCYFLKIVII